MNVKSNPCWHHQYQRRQCCVSRGVVRVPQELYAVIRKACVSFPPPHQLSLLAGDHLISHQWRTSSTKAGTCWRWKQRFFFKIILRVSCYLEAEREARVRIAAPRTVTLPGWIYNSHFNWCQEDTELPVSHFSTALNRLGWTSGMYFVFYDTTKLWIPPVLPTGSVCAHLSWVVLLETFCILHRKD